MKILRLPELLLKNGAYANFGFTPLTSIMQSQTITPIKKQELIEQGHNVNTKDGKGRIPIHYATYSKTARNNSNFITTQQ